MADSIPNALKIINDGVRENSQILRDHKKFGLTETWYVSSKIPPDRLTLLVACDSK